MSFSFGGTPKTVTGFPVPTTTPANTGGFQFGNAGGDAKTTKSGVNLTFTPAQTAPAPTANVPPGGFSFITTPTVTSAPQFNFAPTSTTPTAPQFNLTSATIAPQFNFITTTATAAAPQFSFTSTTTTAAAPQFGFATTPAATTAPQFGFASTAAATTAPQFGTPTATIAATPQYGFPATTITPATPQFNLGSLSASAVAATVTTTSSALSFSLTTTTTPLLLGATATPSAAITTTAVTPSVFPLTGTTLPKQIPVVSTTITTPVSTTLAPTSTPSGPSITPGTPYTPGATVSYSTLEDLINKWTICLEDETKHFTNQAKQMNAWDRLLITNSEKILYLSSGIERVKQLQEQLDQELDFVVAQQKELLDLIGPLEKELSDIPIADMDRQRTYQMAETLDAELKQMSEDLKEIIEHLNESNKHQELANPIYQIGTILNVHMNSLQWVDRQITKITTHLDQISKMHDMNKRNHEINLQKTYE